MQQNLEVIFTNEINTDVFDSTFYQAIFNSLINFWEKKENGTLSENKSIF